MKRKPVILTSVSHYLPGYKAGGPIRTIANIVEALGDEFEFRIVTSDRDLQDTAPYPDVSPDMWCRVGKSWVWYISANRSALSAWRALIQQTPHDLLYLNSLFHPRFTLAPLIAARSTRGSQAPILLAPRGELSPGALALSQRKKSTFLCLARGVGLYQPVIWHASTADEAELIRTRFGDAARIVIARNLPTPVGYASQPTSPASPTDKLRVVFLSRISPMKNLDYALRVLANITFPCQFDIWGPAEDCAYWNECLALIRTLPQHVEVQYRGVADPGHVQRIFAAYDLFFFPTRGENYGHVIAEALSAGTPVLLADTTPWRGLREAGVGWDLPLDGGEAAFAAALEEAHQTAAADRVGWRNRIRDYATARLSDPGLVEASRQLFLMSMKNEMIC